MRTRLIIITLACISILFLFSNYNQKQPVFELLAPKQTGITFSNTLKEDKQHNILTYEYFFNGGGVAVGDINNDGLDDIYFTGNMTENKLYLNQGNFKFKDITNQAGVKGKSSWTTGVSMADINGDGLLDIYVCYSGNGDLESRRNQLFINEGNLKFSEQAKRYGLDDPSNSTQALFFDFDNDGDLDLYLLNHYTKVINEIEFDNARKTRHPFAGDKLFRNDNNTFVDISEAAGIKGNPLGFGLGVGASDFNNDGWMDLYISNDYIEPDYLYINNGDGTFTDRLSEKIQHLSHFSMGLDVADINNDCQTDIVTLDMLPEDNERQKLLYGPENYEQYALMVSKGFYHQNMRNMLQLNTGNGQFVEVGQLAGISNTDWSWSALLFDVTNDGNKDLFISNGYYRDYTNRDFLKYKSDYYFKAVVAGNKADTFNLVSTMTSTPISNYVFENSGNLKFINQTKSWGIYQANFANGAAYADLNNDGYQDLIVNNINQPASIYKNNYRLTGKESNYIQIQLKSKTKNTSGIGSSVRFFYNGKVQYLEQSPARGFQSSVSHRLQIGLGADRVVDSIVVRWPQGKVQILRNVAANQLITIEEKEERNSIPLESIRTAFSQSATTLAHKPTEEGFNDFKRQPLLLEMPSYVAPVLAKADINKDGLTDVLVGGTKGSPAKIYSLKNNRWYNYPAAFQSDADFTDADAVFFDANNDGFMDLYLSSGGYHDYNVNDPRLQDRLYLNDKNGNLFIAKDALPPMPVSSSKVIARDFNNDGFNDLFIGGRIIPGQYPLTPDSYLLINNGNGKFNNQTAAYLPLAGKMGMVTSAVDVDINQDGYFDLIVAGEYMPLSVFINEKGKSFSDVTSSWLVRPMSGWWRSLAVADFDHDNDLDLVAGNFGLNSQIKVSDQQPIKLYYQDFDGNNSIDPILTTYNMGKPVPFASRDELLDQMYSLRSKFTNYAAYATAGIEQILSKEQLAKASVLSANQLASVYLENTGKQFIAHELPIEAQFSPVNAIHVLDYNHDKNPDIILAGNQNYTRIRIGVMDANTGQLFKGDGKGGFTFVPSKSSGLRIQGDVKSILQVEGNSTKILFGINNFGVITYEWAEK